MPCRHDHHLELRIAIKIVLSEIEGMHRKDLWGEPGVALVAQPFCIATTWREEAFLSIPAEIIPDQATKSAIFLVPSPIYNYFTSGRYR
jgi:hypothetical protein